MLLKDKVIIVTGAGTGIGEAAAVMLAAEGARIVATGRTVETVADTVKRIKDSGGVALALPLDVSKESDVIEMVDRTIAEFGRLDGAFNNAGVGMHNKATDELESSEWDDVFNTNARGVFLCMKYEIKAMRRSGGGAIVNNSSIEGVLGPARWSEYSASKHAVNGLTKSAASEARDTGVRINAVLPGFIVTPMSQKLLDDPSKQDMIAVELERHSVGRFGQPDDVAYLVRWLLSDEAAFMNGSMIAVDGGYTAH